LRKGIETPNSSHRFAMHRRILNTIWDISDEDGSIKSSYKEISVVAYNHFKAQYKEIGHEDTFNQINVIKEVP
jgi:hypothetical protein